eukprot:Clim_evm87s128 gene=Clim_evmTU87s128
MGDSRISRARFRWQLSLYAWISSVVAIAIYFHCRGFLLTRTVIDTKTPLRIECRYPNSEAGDDIICPADVKVFDRVVILLVDALRYDFLTSTEESPSSFFHGKLKKTHEILRAYPQNATTARFIADAPTTTLQRLKALVTGSLPTFVDAGSNFSGDVIVEDNIVDVLRRHGKHVVHMGDDTWTALFAREDFHKSFSYPSFVVKDLDTVDDGCLEHLWDELDIGDFDLLVCHFVGIDHCGHWHGPYHPEMERKLVQMDGIISQTIGHLKPSDLLLVFGDHGMTRTGDHGGESWEEVSAGFLAYSPGGLGNHVHDNRTKELYQTDIVPTLLLSLGQPIPFSSIGQVYPPLLVPKCPGDGRCDEKSDLARLSQALALNLEQQYEFLTAYIAVSTGEVYEALQLHRVLIQELLTRYQSKSISPQAFIQDAQMILDNLRSDLVQIWATFDLRSMELAALILFLTVVFFMLSMLPGLGDDISVPLQQFAQIVVGSVAFGLVLSTIPSTDTTVTEGALLGFGIASPIYLICKQLEVMSPFFNPWAAMGSRWGWERLDAKRLNLSLLGSLFFVVALAKPLMVTSNSYIINADSMGAFLVTTYLLVLALHWFVTRKNRHRYATALVLGALLVRISQEYFLCREEQGGCDESAEPESRLGPFFEHSLFLVAVLSLLIMETKMRDVVHNPKLPTFARIYILAVYTGILAFWLLREDEAGLGSTYPTIPHTVRQWIAFSILVSEQIFMAGIILSSIANWDEKPYNASAEVFFAVARDLVLLGGIQYGPSVVLVTTVCATTIPVLPSLPPLLTASGGFLLMQWIMYATGHQMTFSAIRFWTAFVGLDDVYFYASAILIMSDYYAGSLLTPWLIASAECLTKTQSPKDIAQKRKESAPALSVFVMLQLVQLLAAFITTYIQRRHLMLWKIFAPMFIAEGLGTGVLLLMVLVTLIVE